SVLDIEDADALAAIYVADVREVSGNKGAIDNGSQVSGIVGAALVGAPAAGPLQRVFTERGGEPLSIRGPQRWRADRRKRRSVWCEGHPGGAHRREGEWRRDTGAGDCARLCSGKGFRIAELATSMGLTTEY